MDFISAQYRDLQKVAKEFKEKYQNADPFPNIYFENFFDEQMLSEVLEEFPDLSQKGDIQFRSPNENKQASRGESRFGPKAKAFAHYLNSEPFLEFLQELTSIEETLTPDPYFEGGGFHESSRGGFLKVHADFNKHKRTGLDRRLNVLVYLNRDWEDEWGGHFELWNRDMTGCVKKVPPRFNTMALFTTTDFSYHGLPNPIMCPEDRARRSMALYYYTNGRPAHEVNEGLEDHNTLFKSRKGDTVDAEMVAFNKKERFKNLVKDFVPPILVKGAKSLSGRN